MILRPNRTLLTLLLLLLALVLLYLFSTGRLQLPGVLTPRGPSCNGDAAECAAANEVLDVLPPACKKYTKSLGILYDQSDMGGFTDTYGNVLLAGDPPLAQFRILALHECGHIIDFFGLRGTPRSSSTVFTIRTMPTFQDDPSMDFYQISWVGPYAKKPGARDADFVSQYARQNVIEDFAESFVYFILARRTFEERAKTNAALKKKYDQISKLFPADFDLATGDAWNGRIPEVTTSLKYTWHPGKLSAAK